MKFYISENVRAFMIHSLSLMEAFYRNDKTPLFKAIGKDYNSGDAYKKVVKLVDRYCNPTLLSPYAEFCDDAIHRLTDAGQNKDQEYEVSFNREEAQRLYQIFDFCCRMCLGQLSELFYVFCNWGDDKRTPKTENQRDICWNGNWELLDARDAWIPDCQLLGWNGNIGISSPATSQNAKLAYEVSRVFEAATHKDVETRRQTTCLHVSGEKHIHFTEK